MIFVGAWALMTAYGIWQFDGWAAVAVSVCSALVFAWEWSDLRKIRA